MTDGCNSIQSCLVVFGVSNLRFIFLHGTYIMWCSFLTSYKDDPVCNGFLMFSGVIWMHFSEFY